MRDTCESCVHFKPKKGPGYDRVIDGECRAMPPQVRTTYIFIRTTKAAKLDEVIEEASFPMVRNNTWCGLYEDPNDREEILPPESTLGM